MNPDKPSIWHTLGVGGGATPTDLKNNKQLSLWSIAWALTVVAASALLTELDLALPSKGSSSSAQASSPSSYSALT